MLKRRKLTNAAERLHTPVDQVQQVVEQDNRLHAGCTAGDGRRNKDPQC